MESQKKRMTEKSLVEIFEIGKIKKTKNRFLRLKKEHKIAGIKLYIDVLNNSKICQWEE